MSLSKKLAVEMKAAMKAKDKARLRGLRAIKAAILLAKTEKGGGAELDEAKEIKMLQKLVKQRKDSLAIYQQQNRADLAQKEQEEIKVIQEFLPKQLSEAEIIQIIEGIIAKTGASSMRDMGKVMGMASKELKGRADNKTVAGMVKQLLKR